MELGGRERRSGGVVVSVRMGVVSRDDGGGKAVAGGDVPVAAGSAGAAGVSDGQRHGGLQWRCRVVMAARAVFKEGDQTMSVDE